jgi:hypothetical protein
VAQRMIGLSPEELCSNSKRRGTVAVRRRSSCWGGEAAYGAGKLAAALGLDPPAVTRRMEGARSRGKENPEVAKLEKALRERPR